METEKVFHDWLINHLRDRFSKEYSEIKINLEGEEKNEFKGYYPNLILGSYGLVVAVVEVETDKTITHEKVKKWKELSKLGVKLMLMIPDKSKGKLMSMLWDEGIAHDVSVGSYEIKITMP